MSLADDLIRSAMPPAVLAAFGDPVTLPSGAVVSGVFDPFGKLPDAPWSEVGLSTRLGQQPSPSVELRDADAAALAPDARIEIDGTAYRVTAPPIPDGSGLTRVELMLDREDTGARWQ